jgi:predicted nucleic acid-binding Zn ribbon protein
MEPMRPRFPAWRPLEQPEKSLADAVAALAFERGVSERTVWRWIAKLRAEGLQALPSGERQCERCGKALPADARISRRYCEDTCRVYAWRQRRRPAKRL